MAFLFKSIDIYKGAIQLSPPFGRHYVKKTREDGGVNVGFISLCNMWNTPLVFCFT